MTHYRIMSNGYVYAVQTWCWAWPFCWIWVRKSELSEGPTLIRKWQDKVNAQAWIAEEQEIDRRLCAKWKAVDSTKVDSE